MTLTIFFQKISIASELQSGKKDGVHIPFSLKCKPISSSSKCVALAKNNKASTNIGVKISNYFENSQDNVIDNEEMAQKPKKLK